MKRVVVAFAVIALAGCSALGISSGGSNTSGAKKSEGPEIIEVTCSGFVGWDSCNTKAAQTCPKGYNVLQRDESLIAQKRILRFTCK